MRPARRPRARPARRHRHRHCTCFHHNHEFPDQYRARHKRSPPKAAAAAAARAWRSARAAGSTGTCRWTRPPRPAASTRRTGCSGTGLRTPPRWTGCSRPGARICRGSPLRTAPFAPLDRRRGQGHGRPPELAPPAVLFVGPRPAPQRTRATRAVHPVEVEPRGARAAPSVAQRVHGAEPLGHRVLRAASGARPNGRHPPRRPSCPVPARRPGMAPGNAIITGITRGDAPDKKPLGPARSAARARDHQDQ